MRCSPLSVWIVAMAVSGPSVAAVDAGDSRASHATIQIAGVWQGPLRTNATWDPQQNPYTVWGELRVPKGVTLTVLPGTIVLFQAGSRIVINGRLVAEGTAANPIRFTRADSSGHWLGLQFDQTMEDNRICHALLEYARTDDGMIGLQQSRLLLEYVEFDHCDRRRIRTMNSNLTVRRCRFDDIFGPTEAPTTDNMSENIWGSGIPDGGWFLIEENVFGTTKGHNDIIDFDSPAAPKPVPYIHNNTFLGGGDDALDLECDAVIEGNLFLNFVRDPYNKASGESNVLSAGAGKHFTMTHNTFLNSQHVAQVKDGAFLTFVNNTAVNISREAIYFDLNLPGRKPGRGAVVRNSIFWNNVEVFEGITNQIDLTVDHCLMPVQWCNLGLGNISADPLFARDGYWDPNGTPNNTKDDFWVQGDYHLMSEAGRWDPAARQWVIDKVTSPCIDAGNDSPDWKDEPWPNGERINMGAYGGTVEASLSLSTAGTPADLNADDRVDLRDLGAFTAGWLNQEAPRREDLKRDNAVDFTDFAAFASWWLWPTHR